LDAPVYDLLTDEDAKADPVQGVLFSGIGVLVIPIFIEYATLIAEDSPL
jgi:hypothetical protein